MYVCCMWWWIGLVLLMGLLVVVLLVWVVVLQFVVVQVQGVNGYELLLVVLQVVVDVLCVLLLFLLLCCDVVVMMQMLLLLLIQVVVQLELKLVGLCINLCMFFDSCFSFGEKLWLMNVVDGKEWLIIGLLVMLLIVSVMWLLDQKWLVFNQVDVVSGVNELWLVDVVGGSVCCLVVGLNMVIGSGYQWLLDSRGLVVFICLVNLGLVLVVDGVLIGLVVQQISQGGGVVLICIYQDLLKNEVDVCQFDYYVIIQLMEVGLDGSICVIGVVGIFMGFLVLFDGCFVLCQLVQCLYFYVVLVSSFLCCIEVIDCVSGKLVYIVVVCLLVEGLLIGNDVEVIGVCDISWCGDVDVILVWVEVQDGGDLNWEVRVCDVVLMQVVLFDKLLVILVQFGSCLSGINWSCGDLVLLIELWWKICKIKIWLIVLDDVGVELCLLWDCDVQDCYVDLGWLLLVSDECGCLLLQISFDGGSLYLVGVGVLLEGDCLFVDCFDIVMGKVMCLFYLQVLSYLLLVVLLDNQGSLLLLSCESLDELVNFYVQLLVDVSVVLCVLIYFVYLLLQLKGVQKEQICYKCKDGVDLIVILLLLLGYDFKCDGLCLLLMWVYLGEFKSVVVVSQVIDLLYCFNVVSYWGLQVFLVKGYVVLVSLLMLIIGEGDKEFNDIYIEQLVVNVQVVVDEVVWCGVIDCDYIVIGGYFYGVFMIVNLLVYMCLFKVGIVCSGVYNCMLILFGFQVEECNYWQVQDVYQKMVLFNYVDRIKDLILFIYGVDDNNFGMFLIQSECMFVVVKGLGGIVWLVMLLNELYVYCVCELIMIMLVESECWLEQIIGLVGQGMVKKKC